MTSNLRFISSFISLEGNGLYGNEYFNIRNQTSKLIFRPLYEPDLILSFNGGIEFYVLDRRRSLGIIETVDHTSDISENIIHDIKIMDEMELLLKYGRKITDQSILEDINQITQNDYKIEEFECLFDVINC